MRGKARLSGSCRTRARITPAYAGKSEHSNRNGILLRGSPPPMRGKAEFKNAAAGMEEDHPRLCGEKGNSKGLRGARWGSPPPMRGKAYSWCAEDRSSRITPAYAGKSILLYLPVYDVEDHPRLCGEKFDERMNQRIFIGSPPPMRGKVSRFT